MRKYILIFIALVLSSCDALVTTISPDDIPNTEPKLVIGCFLSPTDAFVRVKVLTTIPVFGQINLETTRGIGDTSLVNGQIVYEPSREDITDATVELTGNGRTVQLPFDVVQGVYRIATKDFSIIAGQTYQLKVQAKDGRRVTAQCTVPQAIEPQAITRDSVAATGMVLKNGELTDARGFSKTVNVTWQDPAGVKNYYEVSGFYEYTNLFEERNEVKIQKQTNLIFFGNRGGRDFFESDEKSDGQVLTKKQGTFIPFGLIGFNNRDGSRKPLSSTVNKATINLAHIDENYYKYRLSIYAARSQNFFTEPSIIFSNINGGFGCFGAFNTATQAFYGQ